MKLVKEGDFVVGMSDVVYQKEFEHLDKINFLIEAHEKRLITDIIVSINKKNQPQEFNDVVNNNFWELLE